MKKSADNSKGRQENGQGEGHPAEGGQSPWSPLFFLARLAVGFVLLASGFLKLIEPVEEFAAAIELYQILPSGVIPVLAKTLPWVELIAGGYLAAGFITRQAAAIAGGLYSVFILALGSSMIRRLPMGECGCFGGAGPHLAPWQALALDAVLLTLTTIVFAAPPHRWSLDFWIKGTGFRNSASGARNSTSGAPGVGVPGSDPGAASSAKGRPSPRGNTRDGSTQPQ